MIGLSLLVLLFSIAVRVLEPWPLKLMFDWIIMPQAPTAGSDTTTALEAPGFLAGPGVLLGSMVVALIILTVLRAVSEYYSRVGMAVAATRIVTDVRARLFRHLQQLSLRYHHQAKSGDLVTRFTYDVERLRDTAVTALLPLAANLITMTTMIGIMLWFDWQLALIPVAVLPLFYLTSARTSRAVQQVVREQRRRDGALAAATAEVIGAIKYVQALSLGSLQEKVFARQNRKSLKHGAKAQRLAAGLETKVDIILVVAKGLVLWRGVYLVVTGAITPGTLILFITYLQFMFRPMRQVVKYLTRIARATASGERILEVLDTPLDIRDRPGAVEAGPIKGRIRFDHVCFSYGQRQPVLSDIEFAIEPGQRVALVGASGAGKSTLLALMLRLYDTDSGRILLDGRDIRDYRVDSLRRQFSIVLQDSVLFAVSIGDNIAYGDLEANSAAVERAARLANAHDFIMQLPDGYNTVIGERGATLSGGQLQRIAIARAVIRNAPVMLLDEPTRGLDNINRAEVVRALQRCSAGKTAVLVTHDLLASRGFDRILVIRDRHIEASGSHEELMRHNGFYRKSYLEQYDEQTEQAGAYPALQRLASR
ncbi:MAG: ABC transporter ATP-binding protein [Betaproteobacteria bacterium]|nr:MAG: ABC transporter ATP-binding protein [Betaproteobacteria bacterium]